MPAPDLRREVYASLAGLLDYPARDLPCRAQEAVAQLSSLDPPAAQALEGFYRFVDRTPLGQLEVAYTAAFDLRPASCPYVGYHLFGNGQKRAKFMLALKAQYRAHGYAVEKELPDHLAMLLRFLATAGLPEDEERALAGQCLQPALDKMEQALTASASPYGDVIHALERVLQRAWDGQTDREASTAHHEPPVAATDGEGGG